MVEGEVVEKDERFKRIVVRVIIRNKLEEKVARGSMKIGFVEGDE